MIATLCKRFTFDAAHCLPKLAAGHKCTRLHGHTYEVEIIVCGTVRDNGFVIDYEDMAKAWAPIHEQLDHRYLNDVSGLETPSTEILVHWIWARLASAFGRFRDPEFTGHPESSLTQPPWLKRLRVYESATTWCEIER